MTAMFGEKPHRDASRLLRAWATNQLARVAPGWYVKWTGQTGRGEASAETPEAIADYFVRCFSDYCAQLGIARQAASEYFAGRCVLEYGPGDVPGVALMLLANGVRKVFLADRFPLICDSDKNVAAVRELLRRMSPEERDRVNACLRVPGDPTSGYLGERLQYLVRESGLSGLRQEVDVVLSRAVLEHVDDLEATFADMETALKAGGVAVHLVDLKSHGLHTRNPLDFLTWPELLWRAMYSAKGVPNRWRVNRYREILERSGLHVERLEPTALASKRDVAEVRPRLAAAFRAVSDEDLSWLGFWLVCRK